MINQKKKKHLGFPYEIHWLKVATDWVPGRLGNDYTFSHHLV